MQFLKLRQSLTFRLVTLAILIVVIGSTVRYQLGISLMRNGVQELMSAQQLSLAQYVAADIDQSLRLRQQVLERLAVDLPLLLLDQPEALENWLAQRQNYLPLFTLGLVVIPEHGRGAVADYPNLPGRRQLDFNDRDWFRTSRDAASFYIGKPGIGRAASQGVVNMSVPIKDDQGKVVAVLMGVTALNTPGFLDGVEKSRMSKSGDFILVSQRDRLIVTATDPSLRLKPAPAPGVNLLFDKAMAGWRGTGVAINSMGIETLAAYASVPTANWFTIVRMPTAEALSPANQLLDAVVRNSVISGLVLIVLLVIVLKITFNPLRQSAVQMRAMANGESTLAPLKVHRHDEVGEMVESFNALVDKVQESERKMAFMAHHDALTGLPNRLAFMVHLRQSMALAARQSSKLALLFFDLDGFKKVNDIHGHKVGDHLLQRVAERLTESMRQSDVLGRFGGDEFMLLSTDCPDQDSAALIATKLITTLGRPFEIDGLQVTIGVSVGIAMFPDQCSEVEPMIALADAAMYVAKRNGRNGFRFADPAG